MFLNVTRARGIILLLSLAATALVVETASVSTDEPELKLKFKLKLAEPCSTEKCQAPNCRCAGMSLPKSEFRGKEKEIPQFITVTFDDAVNTINYPQYEELFANLTNPDQCTARGTFYVSHEYTDYVKLNALYADGHEIALHSVSHGTGTDYWREADEDRIMREFGEQIEMMEAFAKINRKHIKGMRLPFLQIAGNNTFVAAKRLGLTFDSSWPTQQFKSPAMWPYTLDYLSVQDCQIGPCPDASVPGFWVNPMVGWTDLEGYSCNMIDGCIYQPPDEVDAMFNWMLDNFNNHYEGNRAPFGMYLHAGWFARGQNHFAAFRKFLLHVTTLPDVYITTASRVLKYMEAPVLGKPFKGCLKKPTSSCNPRSCAVRKVSTGETRYMNVCDHCPEVYPWLDNPLGLSMLGSRH